MNVCTVKDAHSLQQSATSCSFAIFDHGAISSFVFFWSHHSYVAQFTALAMAFSLATAGAAAAAASSSRLKPVLSSTSLTERLQSNDPSLCFLKLYQAAIDHFDSFTDFVKILEKNKTITSVEITWRFLRSLRASARISLLKTIGSMTTLVELAMEVVGPTAVLTTALQNAIHLKSLRVGKLRFASSHDVMELANAVECCRSLEQLSLSSVQLTVEGSHRVDEEGMIWFDENKERSTEMIQLDALFTAISMLPKLVHVQLQHCLNNKRIEPVGHGSLRSLCRAPRRSLVLNACGLKDEHCITIANELQAKCTSLASLVITRNYEITSYGWHALLNALVVNYQLKDFHTGARAQSNEPDAQLRTKIEYYLKLNRAGRGRILCDVDYPRESWVDFLIQGSDDIDILFYALQTNPCICILPNDTIL